MTGADKNNNQLHGSLWLLSENQAAFASDQVNLLVAIEGCGSISAAAKQINISYKTAWERIDAINNMSEKPLVVRSIGGAKGGGTALTDYGKQIIQGFQALEREHASYLSRLRAKVHSLNDIANFVRIGSMQTTARNQFRGRIVQVTPGAVNAIIRVKISEIQSLSVVITQESCDRLGLREEGQVLALIKASAVMISTDIHLATSACNELMGKIAKITPGAVNSDLVVDLGGGKTISAIVTNTSVEDLGLKPGGLVCAFFKASSVILAVD